MMRLPSSLLPSLSSLPLVFVPLPIVPSSLLRLLPLPVVPVLVSPCFHPTSGCSGRRLGVAWWWWPSSYLVISSPLWLSLGGRCWVVPVCVDVPAPFCRSVPSLLLFCPCVHPASSRSRRGLRLRVGWSWWNLVVPPPSSFCCCCLSSPTLRAVARSGGWPSSCPSLLVVVRRVVPVPVVTQSRRLPTVHPASSGSQR